MLPGFWKRGFVAEKVHEFRFSKWVGTANAIGWPVGSFSIPPFMPGLARNPEGLAKLGHRKLIARKQTDKLLFLFHW